MAIERLSTLLPQMIEQTPLGHPDRAYLETLRDRHSLYAESSIRAANVHEFEGRTLVAKSQAEKRKLIASVIPVVASVFGVSPEDVTGTSRLRQFMYPRFASSFLLSRYGDLSLVDIARMYGGKDHTTIINHIDRAEGLIKEDELFAEAISTAESELRKIIAPPAPTNGSNGFGK